MSRFSSRPSWARKAKEFPSKAFSEDEFTENLDPNIYVDPPVEDSEQPLGRGLDSGVYDVLDKTTPAAMRRDLALPILWFLLSTYALTIGAFLFLRLIPGDQPIFSVEDFTASVAAISGLQGLAAAVVGFYFGVRQVEK